jgi:uncharacterized protein
VIVGHAIQLANGNYFDLETITGDTTDIDTIAHSLAMINRYTGHTKEPYSVAQHSVLVSHLVPQSGNWPLWGLLHDISEHVLGDVSRPLKAIMPAYKALEADVEKRLWAKFGLYGPMPWIVKHYDSVALLMEQRDLMPAGSPWDNYGLSGIRLTSELETSRILPLGWRHAKKTFLLRFEELTHEASTRNSPPADFHEGLYE